MAWIESHQSLSRHNKTLDVAEILSISRHEVIGLLMDLWWWGLDNVPSNGCMSRISDKKIAVAAQWDGDASEFTNALITAGFIEEREDGRWLHDWYDYAGKLLVKREKDAERKRKSAGHPTEIQRKSIGKVTEIHRTSERTVPNSTLKDLKDHVCSDDTLKLESHVSIQKTSTINTYSTAFELFWSSYPKRIEKKSAYKAWNTRIRDGTDPQSMIVAAQNYAKSCLQSKTEQRFIKHPKTFLGPNEPFTEYIDEHHDEPEPQYVGRYIPRGLPPEVAAAMEEDERERRRVGSQANRDG